ncbi:MAG: CheR family methyltransferase [Candidatus Rifleibacteriota bacterium]
MQDEQQKSNDPIPRLTDQDFRRLAEFVTNNWGIKLPPAKKVMLEGRLRRRLAALKMTNYKEYCDYLFNSDNHQAEALEMIDFVSTNKTDFFRESDHFRFLQESVLPALIERHSNLNLKIWSAGCSSGEEPYTLAMVIRDFQRENWSFPVSILASDISARVLQQAKMAVYKEEKVAPIPFDLRKRYLLRSKDPKNKVVRFVPEIRNMIGFARVNLMQLENYNIGAPFHIIFCRNVIIYFDRANQERLVQGFYDRLEPEGYLFMGHSEALPGLKVPFRTVAPMVYQKA